MSRTKRKVPHSYDYEFELINMTYGWIYVIRKSTKKEHKEKSRDGIYNSGNTHTHKVFNRANRSAIKHELEKVYKYPDYEEYIFDSTILKKHKNCDYWWY